MCCNMLLKIYIFIIIFQNLIFCSDHIYLFDYINLLFFTKDGLEIQEKKT